MFKQLYQPADFFSTIPVELLFYKIFNAFLHHVCAETTESSFIMDFYREADDFVLLDLLAEHTNRLTQIMIYGETYKGEYSASKYTVELLQGEILSRRGFSDRPTSYFRIINQPSATGTVHAG